MSLSLYQGSVPVYTQRLNGLSEIIRKAISYCADQKIDPAAILQARLYPDMFPFMRQVQIACSHAERGTARLAGLEPPKREDKEASFEDLVKRIETTISYIKSVDSKKMEGMEDRDITFPIGSNKMTLKGADYLFHFSQPNFYFHLTVAYAILRHNGLKIGKDDFMRSE